MSNSFRLGSDGIYRCDAFQQFAWQKHGFGTRQANLEYGVTLKQIHSARVLNAAGLHDREREGDALVTNEIGKCIAVRTADCVPILLLDARHHAVAAVHAGWRGTAAEVVKHAIEKMAADFATAPADIYAAIGPSIQECCYEVGTEVADHFADLFPEWGTTGARRKLNLPEANRRQMEKAGVFGDRIFDCDLCTTCQPAQFFSYRREPENPGRMVAAVCRLA